MRLHCCVGPPFAVDIHNAMSCIMRRCHHVPIRLPIALRRYFFCCSYTSQAHDLLGTVKVQRYEVTRSAIDQESETLALFWPTGAVVKAQNVCRALDAKPLAATVCGHTTLATSSVGCASVRIVFEDKGALSHGGYLFGLKRPGFGQALPAIAGVPRRMDQSIQSHEAIAECVVMARPVSDGTCVTFLPHQVLCELYPVGSPVQVVVLDRVEDFFVGKWSFYLRLKVRIRAVADAALQHLHRLPAVGAPWEPSNEHGSAVVTPAIDADKLGSVVVTPAIDAGKLGSVVVTPAVGDDLSSAVTPTIDAVLVETGLELHAAPPCMKKPCSTTNSLGKEPGFQQFPSGYSKTPEAWACCT